MAISATTGSDAVADIAADTQDALLIKLTGPQSTITFDWKLLDEATSVVSGAGGSVTTAVGQQKYIFDTLISQGASQIIDTYTLTIDYGGGVTYVKNGVIIKVDVVMTGDDPVTFNAHCDFGVGTVT